MQKSKETNNTTLYEYICQLRKEQNIDQETFFNEFNNIIEVYLRPNLGDAILELRNLNKRTPQIMEDEQYINANLSILYILSKIFSVFPSSFVSAETEDVSITDINENQFQYLAEASGFSREEISAYVSKGNFILFGEQQTIFMLGAHKYNVHFKCAKDVKLEELHSSFDAICRSAMSKEASFTLNNSLPIQTLCGNECAPTLPNTVIDVSAHIDSRLYSIHNEQGFRHDKLIEIYIAKTAAGGDKTSSAIPDTEKAADLLRKTKKHD